MASRHLFFALFLGVTSASCDHPDNPTFDYLCDDSRRVIVTYFNVPAPVRARVAIGDVTYDLPQVVSASGARFSEGKVAWWEHGGKAELTQDGTSAECVELP